ncbi:MAG: HDOD domain-containing protein [Melioribacteraceae bacterium]|nr:HDOD domain-containing protein [Melioribacteraceae bacterium]
MQETSKKSQIIDTLEKLRNLPTIPKILFEVQSLLKEETINNIKLANTISKDQGLTTKLLTVANSPLFGLQRKVSSIEFAILLLGGEEIGNIVTAISLSDTIRFNSSANFKFMDYWKHSMIVGTASRDIARRLGMSEIASDAFLAGMLHDLGIQLLIKHFPNEYSKILVMMDSGNQNFYEAEQQIMGCTHEYIGKFLAQKWALPAELCEVLEFHHQPEKSRQNPLLCSIVHLADCMTQEFKIGNTYWDNDISFEAGISDILGFPSLEALGEFTSNYREAFADMADSVQL